MTFVVKYSFRHFKNIKVKLLIKFKINTTVLWFFFYSGWECVYHCPRVWCWMATKLCQLFSLFMILILPHYLLFFHLFFLLHPNFIYFCQYGHNTLSKDSVPPINSLCLAPPLEKSRESETLPDTCLSDCHHRHRVVCVCLTQNSEPPVDAPSFSLWFDDCRPSAVNLPISFLNAFDPTELPKGITAVQCVRPATANIKHPQERRCVAPIAVNPSRK